MDSLILPHAKRECLQEFPDTEDRLYIPEQDLQREVERFFSEHSVGNLYGFTCRPGISAKALSCGSEEKIINTYT
jgi:hypothetical protein